MTPSYVAGIGVWSPLLPSWQACRERLLGEPVAGSDARLPPADWLPAVERRRATLSTRVVLSVTKEALMYAGWKPGELPTVFASSSGSPDITNDLCTALAAGDTQISPTRFHNSVHNAAAGYYSIAVACHASSITLGAHDASAAAGLLEASVLLTTESTPALFVAFDAPYTGPLADIRPIADPFGVALALAPEPAQGQLAQIVVARTAHEDRPLSVCRAPELEYVRRHNPSARLLPLLEALARRAPAQIVLDMTNGGQLVVDVAPC
ncbi:MAG TPA: beta-ketoacyl synthase chain length factor [Burkholderiaceae bacterium]|nr:beta-ketoacyl synthase chain length factor [Burkholderiaceae bacterium]